ncbi:PaaI family thioesterase [Salinivibrio kushneri]|uniref:Acyl-coenzyme A thioesterase THEM4 n=1 Tax=Salinivibrio kushneri TaxID=1908198 RepID=A0AA47KNL3_9GAMM|nr:PaaI family thioesterase [Salinivibrio kushneri]WBA10265.1 PaaI family thioesterase [Salinivibrio kushneri]
MTELRVMPPRSHHQCVACSDNGLFNLKFYQDDNNAVTASVWLESAWQGYQDQLHGGVIATLIDAAFTHCTFLFAPQSVTASLNIRYHHPVPIAVEAEIHAWCVKAKHGMSQLEATLTVADTVCASATASFMRMRASKTS